MDWQKDKEPKLAASKAYFQIVSSDDCNTDPQKHYIKS